MKKIIRFLAKITGVEKEIQKNATMAIAYNMKADAWWFSSAGDAKAYNAFHLYADGLRKLGHPPSISPLRDRVRALGDNHIDGHDTERILECEYRKV